MQRTASPARFRYLGITDECVECRQCGRTELRSTVVLAILDEDGTTEDITYYGSTCAARALAVKGGGRAVLQSARRAHEKTLTDAQQARDWLTRHNAQPDGTWASPDAFKFGRRMFARNNVRAFEGKTLDQIVDAFTALAADKVAAIRAANLLDPAF